jgi:hypothetical protein
MISKVKQWLGIEGLKMELELPKRVVRADNVVRGHVLLLSKRKEKVDRIAVRLVERYKRGRWKGKKISEFTMGEVLLEGQFIIPANEVIKLPFTLHFDRIESDMDKMERRNVALKGVVAIAKLLKGVESEYWVEAEARVKGTVIDPMTKKYLQFG